MMEESKILGPNLGQAILKLVNPNVAYCTWPRGQGKTFAMGDRIEHLSEAMPRSQIILFADTFKRLEDRIVPNVMNYLINESGLVDGEDFVVFKTPPDDWDKPLIPLKKFEHVISFASGMALCLASQQVPGSANAYNAQAMLADEAKYLDETTLNTEVLPALRGAFNYFGKLPEYRSHWYFTDKYGENIKWILAKRKLHKPERVKAIITLALKVIELEQRIANAASTATEYKYLPEKIKYENILQAARRELVFFSDPAPYENLPNLGEKYFRDLKRDLSAHEYSISVENRDPDKAEFSFYPALAAHHYHDIRGDVHTNEPLIMTMDYQWRISPMTVAQFGKLPGQPYTTLNFVAAVHTLHPDGGIEKTVDKFAKEFMTHSNKTMYYCYDHTAVGKRPDGKSFKEITCKALSDAGWSVIEIYMGQAPYHDIKFAKLKTLLTNIADMSIRIHKPKCQPMITSMENAAAVMSMGKTKKDKRGEKNLRLDPLEQTDYSDAFDQLVWAVLEMKLITPSSAFTMPMMMK